MEIIILLAILGALWDYFFETDEQKILARRRAEWERTHEGYMDTLIG